VHERLFADVTQLIESPSSEERVAVLYCLTHFLNAFDPLRVLRVILSQAEQICHMIRCQVLSALSIFYAGSSRKFFLSDDPTEIDAQNALIRYSLDSHPLVAQTAVTLVESLTLQRNAVHPSNLLSSFVSLLLSPCAHLLASPQAPLARPPRATQPLAPPAKLGSLSAGTYAHSATITSNLAFAAPDSVLFGDCADRLNIRGWASPKVAPTQTGQESPITCVRYLENHAFPLVFAANRRGHCLAMSAADEKLVLVSGLRFPVPSFDATQMNYAFDVDPVYGRLTAYEPGVSEALLAYDLRAERVLAPVAFDGRPIWAARGIAAGTSMIGVCTERALEIADLRTKDSIATMGLAAHALDFHVVDATGPSFLVCARTGFVQAFDLRHMDRQLKSMQVKAGRAIEALSFALLPRSSKCCVGHRAGVVVLDVVNDRQTVVAGPRGWFGSGVEMVDVEHLLFHPGGSGSLLVHHTGNCLSLFHEVADA
jgi:hypothetical protein